MSPRSAALGLGALLVIAALGYLALELRSAPPEPPLTSRTTRTPSRAPAATTPAPVDDAAPRARAGSAAAPTARPAPQVASGGASTPRTPPSPSTTFAARPDAAPPPDAEPITGDLATLRDRATDLMEERQYDEALRVALAVLERDPGRARMIRVVTASACNLGDRELAESHFAQLKEADQEKVGGWCERAGMTITPAAEAP